MCQEDDTHSEICRELCSYLQWRLLAFADKTDKWYPHYETEFAVFAERQLDASFCLSFMLRRG
jgi:hypothetical protein